MQDAMKLSFRYTLYRAAPDLSIVNDPMDRWAREHSRWLDHEGPPDTGDECYVTYAAPYPGCTVDRPQRGWLVAPALHWTAKRSWLPDFDNALRLMLPGESGRFEVRFPMAFHEPALAGKRIEFEATLHKVRRRTWYTCADEIAADNPRILPRIEQVRERARIALTREAEMTAEWLLERQILADIEGLVKWDVPFGVERIRVGMKLVADALGVEYDRTVFAEALPKREKKRTLEVRRAAKHIALERAVLRRLKDEAKARGSLIEVAVSRNEQQAQVTEIAKRQCVEQPKFLDGSALFNFAA
jgi:FKBP-type peptidyl-prolyl cis-trans isomerase (trigger factor)